MGRDKLTKKVLIVATVVKTHIMEFHIPILKMFKEMGWETAVAAKNDYKDPKECQIPYCDKYYNVPFERSPFKTENIVAYRNLKKIINNNNFDIIHCNTPVASVITRLVAKKARKKGSKIFYTAHGFHFYTGAPLINWLLYYPVERFLARYTDVLITINKEDYNRAKKFRAKKVVYIPGVGIDLKKFRRSLTEKGKRQQLGLSNKNLVLLSVGELIPRKNHEIVLKAISSLKNNSIYSSIKYLICGDGELKDYLKDLTIKLGIENHVLFLGYRKDVYKFYSMSDIFIFMSKQEGLPVALMEAMASDVPIICSRIRGNVDLVKDNINGLFAENNCESISNRIVELTTNKKLRLKLKKNELKYIEKFELTKVLKQMKKIYLEELHE